MEYKTARWKQLRAAVLRRDEYQCRECRRYGRRREASVVHHAYPAVDFPAWRWEAWNLVSLCPACHNAMHVRDTDELTERGLAWQRRVRRPGGGLPTGEPVTGSPADGPPTASLPTASLPTDGLARPSQ